MKRVAQTENKNKKYGTQKSVKGVEQQGEGEELKKKQVEGGRAGEVVKGGGGGGGRKRQKRRRVIHMLWYIGLQKMDTYNNLTQDRVLYANVV